MCVPVYIASGSITQLGMKLSTDCIRGLQGHLTTYKNMWMVLLCVIQHKILKPQKCCSPFLQDLFLSGNFEAVYLPLCNGCRSVSAKEEEQALGSAWTACMALPVCRVSSPWFFRAIMPLYISPENTSIFWLERNPVSMQPALRPPLLLRKQK